MRTPLQRPEPLPSVTARPPPRADGGVDRTGDDRLGGCAGRTKEEVADAAAYDPRAKRWRPLPEWRTRWLHAAVWTGKEMIVWGGDGDFSQVASGAAFSPASQRWRALPPGLLEARGNAVAVWTGSEVLVLGGAGNRPLQLSAAAYSLDPLRRRRAALCSDESKGC